MKRTESSDKPAPSKNNDIRLASSRNDNSKLTFEKNNSNSEVNRFDDDGIDYANKWRKLSKSEKLKGEKLAKSKKASKNKNSPNFGTKKTGSSFLTSNTRITFNYLWLVFI